MTADRKELRNFGISLAVVCLLWAAILWWRGHTGAIPWLLGASPVLILLALVAPVALWPLHKVWMPVGPRSSRCRSVNSRAHGTSFCCPRCAGSEA